MISLIILQYLTNTPTLDTQSESLRILIFIIFIVAVIYGCSMFVANSAEKREMAKYYSDNDSLIKIANIKRKEIYDAIVEEKIGEKKVHDISNMPRKTTSIATKAEWVEQSEGDKTIYLGTFIQKINSGQKIIKDMSDYMLTFIVNRQILMEKIDNLKRKELLEEFKNRFWKLHDNEVYKYLDKVIYLETKENNTRIRWAKIL